MKLATIIGLWALVGATALGCSSPAAPTGFNDGFGDDGGGSSGAPAASGSGSSGGSSGGPLRAERARAVRAAAPPAPSSGSSRRRHGVGRWRGPPNVDAKRRRSRRQPRDRLLADEDDHHADVPGSGELRGVLLPDVREPVGKAGRHQDVRSDHGHGLAPHVCVLSVEREQRLGGAVRGRRVDLRRLHVPVADSEGRHDVPQDGRSDPPGDDGLQPDGPLPQHERPRRSPRTSP